MASRRLEDLDPVLRDLAQRHIQACAKLGIDLLIYCTNRSNAEQAELYTHGRTAPGKIVTYAKPGESKHNISKGVVPMALAYDCVPIRAGKAIWDSDDPEWQIVGREGERLGLSWAGRWVNFREFPHFELKGVDNE